MTAPGPIALALAFYRVFVRDTARLVRTVPRGLKARWWSVLAFQLLSGALETLSLVCISVFALSVASPESVPENFLVRPILALFPSLGEIFGSPRRIVALTSIMMALSIALKCSVGAWATRASAAFSELTVSHVSTEAVRRYMARDYLWHITEESREAVLKMINRNFLSEYTTSLLLFNSNAVVCLMLFAALSVLEPALTLATFAVFGTCALLLYTAFRRRLDREGGASERCVREENRILMAASRGIREITVHRAQGLAVKGFSDALARGLRPRVLLLFTSQLPVFVLETVGFATMGAIVAGMLARGVPMEDIVQTASLLMLTAWRILPAVNRCLYFSVRVRGLRAMAVGLLDLLDSLKEEGPPPPPDPAFRFGQGLELREVSFRYPGAAADALCGVSLRIRRGARVGLVGPSGSGKSSLALVLSALAPPTRGEFLVDGRPLTPAGREAWFRILGYVPQDPLLLDGTLAENVAFGDWGEAADEARVRMALRRAAADFAESDPRGLGMPLSGDAPGLSGGQIQRVAIARALYSDPQVILFDEATSALDQASENLVRRTLAEAGDGVTLVVIAHRLSTVEFCDEIHWLDGGRIVRSGPPSEIIPLYAKDAELREAARASAREGGAEAPAPGNREGADGEPRRKGEEPPFP
jgi:ABC-type multidrug transport system fused ATPase/permease subunit